MTALYVLSSIGGATAFFGAVWVIVRALFGQVNATKDNTDAVRELTSNLQKLQSTVEVQGRDIAYLKGRWHSR